MDSTGGRGRISTEFVFRQSTQKEQKNFFPKNTNAVPTKFIRGLLSDLLGKSRCH